MDLSLFTSRIINESITHKTLADFLLTLNNIVGSKTFDYKNFVSSMAYLDVSDDKNKNKKIDENELALVIKQFKKEGAKDPEIYQFFKLFGLYIYFENFFTLNRLKENFSPSDINGAIDSVKAKIKVANPNDVKVVKKNSDSENSDDNSDDESENPEDSDDDEEGEAAVADAKTNSDYFFIRDKNNFKPNNNNKQIISLNNFLFLVSKKPKYFNHFKATGNDFGFGRFNEDTDKINLISDFKNILEHPEKYLTANQEADIERQGNINKISNEINNNLNDLKGVESLKSKIESGTHIETGKNDKNSEMDFTPEDKETLNRVMGRNYSESISKSGTFGVAAPSLVAGIGSEEEPEKGVKKFLEKFDEAFKAKIEEYTSKITNNLDIINKNKKNRKSEGKINFNNEAINVFNKVIEENFRDKIAGFKNNIKKDWNELGAIFKPGDSRADNVANLINNRKEKLNEFYRKAKRKLENDINDLTDKYYSELHAAKRISIAHKVHTKYLNFIRDVEEEFEEFRKTAEIYIDDTNRLVKKANIQTDKRNAKNNLIGLPGKYKREDFESAKKLLTENLNGKSTESKLAIVLLYNIVNDLSGEIKSKDLLNLINKGSNNFKVYSPENIKEQNLDANKYGFDKLYDLTTLNSYTVPRSLLNNILGSEKVNFVFENPEIFKFIKNNENFKNAYNEFIEGINENIPFTPGAKDKGIAGKTQFDKNNLAQTNIGYITKAESAKELSDLNFLTAETKSYKDLGKLTQLCMQKRVVVSGNSGIYTVKKSAFEASKNAIDNPNEPMTIEQEKNDNQDSQTEKKPNEQKAEDDTPSQTETEDDTPSQTETEELRKACINIYDEIAKQFSDAENNYKKLNLKGEDASNISQQYANIKKDLNDFKYKKDRYKKLDYYTLDDLFHSLETLSRNITAFINTVENQPQAKANNSNGLFFQIKNKFTNISNKIKGYLKDIQEAKRAGVKYGSRKAEQIAAKGHANNYSNENATVTTAAADSTYGNGYNYKPKRIREIIYKKGDYTVKTKEEI